MKKTFDIEWQANRNHADDKSVVAFSAVSQENPEEQYAGTFTVRGTDDAAVNAYLDDNLSSIIRAVRERTNG
jgi:hypothetical protein